MERIVVEPPRLMSRMWLYASTCTSTLAREHVLVNCMSKENNCLHSPYRSKFTVASRGFHATARFLFPPQ